MSLLNQLNLHAVVRPFKNWINSIFNKVDYGRIKEIGPDQAAAEWLLRCGAAVKWQNSDKWESDYNNLQKTYDKNNKISEIDATESCIMHVGFDYFEGLKHVKRVKFIRCMYLEDRCLEHLSLIKNFKTSIEAVEMVSCGNLTNMSVIALTSFRGLKEAYLYDLPEVNQRENCLKILRKTLPDCKVEFPPTKESTKESTKD